MWVERRTNDSICNVFIMKTCIEEEGLTDIPESNSYLQNKLQKLRVCITSITIIQMILKHFLVYKLTQFLLFCLLK